MATYALWRSVPLPNNSTQPADKLPLRLVLSNTAVGKQAVTNCSATNAPPFPPHHRPSPVCTSAEVFSHSRAQRCSAVAVRRQARTSHPPYA
jgi:hypothetical protein